MPNPDWRTSSYTNSDSCVEVADNQAGVVWVRDTKDRGGRMITLSPVAWADFVSHASQVRLYQ
jgi:hypothetical protein